MLVAADDVIRRQEPRPHVVGLRIEGHAVLLRSLEDGGVHPLGRQFVDLGQQLPRPFDRLPLEVIAVGPVAQHLEHGVVVGVVPHLFQIVVLARYAQAFLCVGRPRIFARSVAQKDVLELVHARIGEHQRRIALDHHRSRGNDLVSLAPEKVQKGLANFIRFHI